MHEVVYYCTYWQDVMQPGETKDELVLVFLQVLGNVSEFHRAVKLVIDTVTFDKDSTVQVFEANIRCSIL